MATLTGTNLLNSIIDSTGIAPSALLQSAMAARLQLMIDAGLTAKLGLAAVITGFSPEIAAVTEPTGLSDQIETNTGLIEAAADEAAVDALDFPDYGGPAPITYTLTSSADSVLEGATNSYTVTASNPVAEDTTITFNVVVGDTTAADAGTSNTNLDDFVGGTFNPVTATILAGETTAVFNVVGENDGLTELPEAYSVTAVVNGETLTTSVTLLDGAGTFTLTTGIDTGPNFVGTLNNDTFNALDAGAAGTSKTFTALDSIDGAGGTDTLNVIQSATMPNLPSTTVANIEIANLNTADAIGGAGAGNAFDTSAWTGLETLNLKSIGGTYVKAAATTDVNELTSISTSAITGGKDVTVVHKTAGNLDVDMTAGALNITSGFGKVNVGDNGLSDATDTALNALGAVTVNMTAVKTADADTVVIDGGTTIDVTATGAVAYADEIAHTAAATAAATAVTTATAADTAADAKVTGVKALQTALAATDGSADTVAETMLLTCAANTNKFLTQAEKVSIDAAFSAAYSTTTGTTAQKVTAAQAATATVMASLVTAAETAAAATQSTLDAATTAKTAADAVVTADGLIIAAVDDMDVTATENTALTSVTIKGNDAATNTVTDASTSSNTLTTVTLEDAGTATLTGKALVNVNLTNQTDSVTISNSTAEHTQNLTLDTVVGATVADAAAKVVNVASTGTNSLTLNAAAATEINISGGGKTTFSGASTGAANAVITSTATGNVSMSTAVGQAYTGGAGVDTITTAAGLQTAKVDGGAGDSDKMVITNAANVATTGAALYHNFEVLGSKATTLDVSKFTNSTFTGLESVAGAVSFDKVNATQAANVAVKAATTALTIGVTDATVPGNIDTVNLNTVGTISLGAGLTLAGVEKVNVAMADSTSTADDAGFTMTDLTNMAALTDLTFTGNGSVNVQTAALAVASNATIDASAVTGKSTDTVVIDATSSTDNGLTIKGSATLGNTLTAATGLANGKATVLTGGAGNDTITGSNTDDVITGGEGNNTIRVSDDITDTGTDTVTVGDGNNSIFGDAGVDKITAGNGYNVITTYGGNDVITVGTGGACNLGSTGITAGTGADSVTLGAHAAGVVAIVTQGVADSIKVSAKTTADGGSIAAGDVFSFANGVDVITGFDAATDKIYSATSEAAVSLIAQTENALGATNIYFASGAWDATAKTFTVAANGTGADTMIVDTANTGTTDIMANEGIFILKGVDSDTLTSSTFGAKGSLGALSAIQAQAAYVADNAAVYSVVDEAATLDNAAIISAGAVDQATAVTISDAATTDIAATVLSSIGTKAGATIPTVTNAIDVQATTVAQLTAALSTAATKVSAATATAKLTMAFDSNLDYTTVKDTAFGIASGGVTLIDSDNTATIDLTDIALLGGAGEAKFDGNVALTLSDDIVGNEVQAFTKTLAGATSITIDDTTDNAYAMTSANYSTTFSTNGLTAAATDTITVTVANSDNLAFSTAAVDKFDLNSLTAGQTASITVTSGDKIDLSTAFGAISTFEDGNNIATLDITPVISGANTILNIETNVDGTTTDDIVVTLLGVNFDDTADGTIASGIITIA